MNSRTPYSNGSNAGIILTGGIQASECTARSRSRASTTRQALAPDPTLLVFLRRGESNRPPAPHASGQPAAPSAARQRACNKKMQDQLSPGGQNVRPKREHGPHRNVKTTRCAARDSNPEPAD